MIGLKELTRVDEAIKCLGYITLKYIKVYPYAHPNCDALPSHGVKPI